ncbi:MAG: Uma2 family endonuclease [Cyanobacteriota bacterium]|nr:Uma2 family endonuclease [Cyanobacteriota bacterium]
MTLAQETPVKPVATFTVTWEPLPDDFQLDEEPVDNIDQPLLAGALSESLELASYIQPQMLVAGNLGICATLNEQLVIKAPDWFFVPRADEVAPRGNRKSYTPHLEGEIPTLVMEFLSDKGGSEYSVKQVHPLGKWFFYEQILKIPTYIIFEPEGGLLEVYRLRGGCYKLEMPDPEGRHWIEEMGLYLGTWRGEKEGRNDYWLRWWDRQGDLLLWGVELVQQERQRAEVERQQAEAERQRAEAERQRAEVESRRAEVESQRAEAERQRAEKLAAYLRQQGIDPNELLS